MLQIINVYAGSGDMGVFRPANSLSDVVIHNKGLTRPEGYAVEIPPMSKIINVYAGFRYLDRLGILKGNHACPKTYCN